MRESAVALLDRLFSGFNRQILSVLFLLLAFQALMIAIVFGLIGGRRLSQWLPELAIATLFTLLFGAIVLSLVGRLRERAGRDVNQIVTQELQDLQAAEDRARSLQAMASTLSATLSFERVVDEALDVCSLALAEMGIPRESLVGAVFLYEDEELRPVARRRFLGEDAETCIPGKLGVVGAALTQAEPVVTNNPEADPELRVYAAFRECLTAVCVPLRAGFQLFGAMVIGTDTAVQFDKDHFDLFTAVGDQAVIALQNAQLYQRLEAEKHRLIEADEQARRELARDLHDGPTQTIAAIAMRISFIRSLIDQNPERAKAEMQKIEDLAKKTSVEVRSMLFTLRPLVLEAQGLGAAVDTLLKRYSETDGVEMRLIGGEHGRLLNKAAQGVVFSIVEEALSNARKHANATIIEVRFWRADTLFAAAVHDNGVGFDLNNIARDYNNRDSLGMVNMRERAERIDGSLRVESSPGSGTTVTLVVPLETQGVSADEDDEETVSFELADAEAPSR